MDQPANRKGRGRGRGRKPNPKAAERHRRNNQKDDNDPRSFWERSNARLGVSVQEPSNGRRSGGRNPVEYPCSVCGTTVSLDRWPKHRHDVICSNCRREMSGMVEDEDEAGVAGANQIKGNGLPEFTEEDLEAIAALRADGNLGMVGQNKNRRKRGGRGQGGNRSRNGNGNRNRSRNGNGNGNGQQRRADAPKGEGEGGQKRRRRRRRRSGGKGGGGEEGSTQASSAPQATSSGPSEG